MIPVLMLTYNRLAYTQIALPALINSREVEVVVIDNGSTDGTVGWLKKREWRDNVKVIFNETNIGIAGAMNQFRELTAGAEYVGKVDNDTVVNSAYWAIRLRKRCRAFNLDIVQAAHPLIPEVAAGKSFTTWTSLMPFPPGFPNIRYHHFVGGSGILIRRDIFGTIPDTEWLLYGWRQFQREHPHLKTAFCRDVSVSLLDSEGAGHRDYPAYYKETGRIKC